MFRPDCYAATALCLFIFTCVATIAVAGEPGNVYCGEMVSYPGPWAFKIPKQAIILVSDAELETLATDPDKVQHSQQLPSLRQTCERGKKKGARTLLVAFDHFFKQYRPGISASNR